MAKAGPDFYGALARALQCITEVIGSFWAPCQLASGLLGDHFRSLAPIEADSSLKGPDGWATAGQPELGGCQEDRARSSLPFASTNARPHKS